MQIKKEYIICNGNVIAAKYSANQDLKDWRLIGVKGFYAALRSAFKADFGYAPSAVSGNGVSGDIDLSQVTGVEGLVEVLNFS